MRFALLLGVAASQCLVLCGCGDDDSDPADTGMVDTGMIDTGSGDASSDTPADTTVPDTFVPGDAGPTVVYDFHVRDLLTGDNVVLAEVCVFEVPEIGCVMVDEMGRGAIEVPINSEIQLRTTALRYFPELTTYTTTEETRDVDIDLGKRSNIVPLLRAAGVTADETKAQLAWLAQTGPGMGLAGVTATLVPASGEGAFYTLDSLPSMEQLETSEDGLGLFANVDPGRVEVVYDNPNGDCVFSEGWEGSGPNRVATNVEAETLTIIIAFCDGAPVSDAGVDAPMDAPMDAPDAGL